LLRCTILRILFVCLEMVALSISVQAQKLSGVTEIPDPKMVLNQVKLISQGPSESVFEVEFYPKLPPFDIIRDINERETGKTNLEIRFENSRKGPSSTEFRFSGLVNQLIFESLDPDISVKFAARDPSKISVQQISETKLLTTIKRVPKRASSSFDDFGNIPKNNVATIDSEPKNEKISEPNDEDSSIGIGDEASEVVGLLTEGISVRPNNIFIRREPGFGSPGKNNDNGGNSRKPEDNEQPLGESVDRHLAIDRRLNAVWVRGSRERIELVKKQIAKIDVPVDSVILETQFVELSENGARNLGIDFANSLNQTGVATAKFGEFVPLGLDSDQILKSFSLQAALYAQIQKGEGRILSKPRIAAQSGSTAKIITGDALPILTSITLSGVDGVSQQVQYVNVGVTLQIAPRVSPDDYVTSQIYAVVSSVTGYSQGYPTISQREAETSASVRNGESFVIGGLTQENYLTSKSKVPILGDIPLLGKALSYEKTSKGKTELYIVITPRIVRHRQVDEKTSNSQENIIQQDK
jgi:general secretion pathway protein D